MSNPSILIAHDLRAGGASAFEAGVALARDLGADIVLAHAFRPRYMSQADVIHVSLPTLKDLEAMVELGDAHELADTWANEARKRGLEVTTDIGEGDPAKFILAAAERHESLVIVVGGGGRRGLRQWLPGSTAASVIRHSNRPVLIAPPPLAGGRRPAQGPRPEPGRATATPRGKGMMRTPR